MLGQSFLEADHEAGSIDGTGCYWRSCLAVVVGHGSHDVMDDESVNGFGSLRRGNSTT